MKSNGDVDDGVFDWNLLNGESSAYLFFFLFATMYSCPEKVVMDGRHRQCVI
jgi:hypothetical protein